MVFCAPRPAPALQVYNELYTHLLDCMHAALNGLTDERPKKPVVAVPGPQDLARLLALARECEVQGQAERAGRLHAQRLLDRNNAQVRCRCTTLV